MSDPSPQLPPAGTLSIPAIRNGRKPTQLRQREYSHAEIPLPDLIELLCGFRADGKIGNLCPLCRTPVKTFRLMRNEARDRFICTTCGSGDAVNFLQRLLHLNEPGARLLWFELALMRRARTDAINREERRKASIRRSKSVAAGKKSILEHNQSKQ